MLHSFIIEVIFLSSKVANILSCPNKQFDIRWYNVRYTIHRCSVAHFQMVSDTKYDIQCGYSSTCLSNHSSVSRGLGPLSLTTTKTFYLCLFKKRNTIIHRQGVLVVEEWI